MPTSLPFDAARFAGLLSASGPSQDWQSPYDPELRTAVPTTTAQDLADAVTRARAAQQIWAARPIEERAEIVLDFGDRVLADRDRLADLIQYESGKSRLSAMEEVLHVALSARYYGLTARQVLHSRRGRGLLPMFTRVDVHRVPKGVVGVIGPWNYPLTMAVSDGLAALVAGNAVLTKPDLQTPFSVLAAAELLHAAGLPAALWPVVNGPGGELGPQLIEASDYVCFTGSTATGVTVAQACAGRLIGCSLELGGKNPLLVLDDVDVAQAAAGAARASFANAGQLCVSMERIYVADSVREEFTRALVEATRAIRLGNSLSYDHDMGGLISAVHLERVEAHVSDAVAQGATVLAGGRRRPDLGPLFFEPTILTDVTPSMDCARNETFGPVVSLYSARDDDDAVQQANDSAYGLNASVWTRDTDRGRAVAARIRCGTVNVNEGYAATFGSLDAPMGGMKESGIGRRQGPEGILRFTETQSVATQTGMVLAPSPRMPAERLMNLMAAGAGLLKRVGRP